MPESWRPLGLLALIVAFTLFAVSGWADPEEGDVSWPEPARIWDPEVLGYLEELAQSESRIHSELLGTDDLFVALGESDLPPSWRRAQVVHALYLTAVRRAADDRWQEAETLCREALRLDPGAPTITLSLAEALMAQGRLNEAIELLRAGETESPGNHELLELLAIALRHAGQHSEASDVWRKLCALAPGDIEHRLSLAMSLAQANDPDGALQTLREVSEMAPSISRLGPDQLQYIFFLAELAQNQGDFEQAQQWYERLIESRPRFLLTYHFLGRLHLSQGREEEALETYRRGLVQDPRSANLRRAVQNVFGPDRSDDHLTWWADFADAYPHDVEIWLAYAETLLAANRTERAIEVLQDLVRNNPDNPGAHLRLGILLREAGRSEEAIGPLRRALALNPTSEPAVDNLLEILRGVGRLDDARSVIDTTAFEPAARARRLVFLARTHARHRHWDEAEEAFREAVRVAPEDPTLRVALMSFLSDRGQTEDGLQVALDAVKDFGLLHPAVADPTLFGWVDRFGDSITDLNRDEVSGIITAAAEESGTAAAMRVLGLYHQRYGDKNLVAETMATAWDLATSEDDRIGIIRFHLTEGDRDLAHDLIREAEQDTPDSVRLSLWKGVALHLDGQPDQAEKAWQRALNGRQEPRQISDFMLINVINRLGREELDDVGLSLTLAAIRARGLTVEVIGPRTINLAAFFSLFEEAVADRFEETETALREAAGEEPDAQAWALVANLCATHDQTEKAREAFLAARRAEPDDAEWAGDLAAVCRQHDMPEIAEELLQEAIAEYADSDELLYQLGFHYDEVDRIDDAEQAFRRALEINPDNYMVLNHLGYMFSVEGINLREALQLTERAVELSDLDVLAGEPVGFSDNNGFIVDSLGWAHFKLNHAEEAVHWLGEAIRRAERGRMGADGVFYDHLGDALCLDGQIEEAVDAWDRALALYEQADLEVADRTGEILAVCEKILEVEPGRTEIVDLVNGLGDTLMRDGQVEEAVDAWDRALTFYQRRNQTQEILAVCEKILEVEPDRGDITDLVKQLRQPLDPKPAETRDSPLID